jgi:hypothetical protein
MKKFPLSYHSGSKGAALIIGLGLLAAVVSPTSPLQASPTPSPTSSPSQTPCPSPTPGCAAISSVQIATAGNLYNVGDILDPLSGNLCGSGDNYGFRLQVASVDNPSTGRVTGVAVVPCIGIGYSAPPSNPIRFGGSPTGTGFTANCTFH